MVFDDICNQNMNFVRSLKNTKSVSFDFPSLGDCIEYPQHKYLLRNKQSHPGCWSKFYTGHIHLRDITIVNVSSIHISLAQS